MGLQNKIPKERLGFADNNIFRATFYLYRALASAYMVAMFYLYCKKRTSQTLLLKCSKCMENKNKSQNKPTKTYSHRKTPPNCQLPYVGNADCYLVSQCLKFRGTNTDAGITEALPLNTGHGRTPIHATEKSAPEVEASPVISKPKSDSRQGSVMGSVSSPRFPYPRRFL